MVNNLNLYYKNIYLGAVMKISFLVEYLNLNLKNKGQDVFCATMGQGLIKVYILPDLLALTAHGVYHKQNSDKLVCNP